MFVACTGKETFKSLKQRTTSRSVTSMRRRLGPTEMEQAFIENYTEHGDQELAATQAGYSEKCIRSIASQLKRKLRTEIDARLAEKMNGDCAIARSVIVKLCTSSESEDIKLKAAKDILDRGGHPASKEIVSVKQTHSPGQLIERLREQLGDDVANAIAKNYTPTHEQPETPQ